MQGMSTTTRPRVLIIDDNSNFVKTTVACLDNEAIDAEGMSDIPEVFRAARRGDFGNYDIVFVDMRLSTAKGKSVSAADVLLHCKTYSPKVLVIVFTQKDITPEECVQCMQWGALGIIPKASNPEEFGLMARVDPRDGGPTQIREALIGELWNLLTKSDDAALKGKFLEMLVINVFNSIGDFPVIGNNRAQAAGEIDIILENHGRHEFWKALNSLHIVVECKSGGDKSETDVFNVLSAKAKRKEHCRVGILVGWEGATKGFNALQSAGNTDAPLIYSLGRAVLKSLVHAPPEGREEVLRLALAGQL